jgi:hypothetical protein
VGLIGWDFQLDAYGTCEQAEGLAGAAYRVAHRKIEDDGYGCRTVEGIEVMLGHMAMCMDVGMRWHAAPHAMKGHTAFWVAGEVSVDYVEVDEHTLGLLVSSSRRGHGETHAQRIRRRQQHGSRRRHVTGGRTGDECEVRMAGQTASEAIVHVRLSSDDAHGGARPARS